MPAPFWVLAAVLLSAAAAQHAAAPAHGVMNHFPRWSPDGRTLVVSSTEDGDSEIYLLRLDGGRRLKLTDNDPFDDAARWTEDGRRIVFTTADGSDARVVSSGTDPSRSPDGRRIAYLRDDRERTDVWVMDADGDGQKCLTCPSSP